MKTLIHNFYHKQGKTHYVGMISPRGLILNTVITGVVVASALYLISVFRGH